MLSVGFLSWWLLLRSGWRCRLLSRLCVRWRNGKRLRFWLDGRRWFERLTVAIADPLINTLLNTVARLNLILVRCFVLVLELDYLLLFGSGVSALTDCGTSRFYALAFFELAFDCLETPFYFLFDVYFKGLLKNFVCFFLFQVSDFWT